MYRGKPSVSLLFAALVAAGLPALGVGTAHAAPERRLDHKTVVLTTSVPGYPMAGAPAGRQLRRAVVRVRYLDDGTAVIDADVSLRSGPADNSTDLDVGVGRRTSTGDCDLTQGVTMNVWVNDVDYSTWHGIPASTTYDCAGVQVRDQNSSSVVHDRMGGQLANQFVQPRLTVSRPRLLDRAQKQVRLVRGVTQNHTFIVKNTGKYRARNVTVTARGKGMTSVRRTAGTLLPGEEKSVTVPLRLRAKINRTTVRFTVAGSGVKASRVVTTRAVKAPAKPRAGAWRSSDRTFTFKVKRGQITHFRGVNMRMKCGGYGSYPTYRNVTLTFPKVKVPRHGYVDAVKRYRKGDVWYTATLRGRVVGTKMTRARYTYSTAGSCRVSEGFAARRR